MTFAYNEEACKTIIKLYQSQIEKIQKEIGFLSNESDLTDEAAVKLAFKNYINKLELDVSQLDINIKMLQENLQVK